VIPYQLVQRKRNGEALASEDLREFFDGYTSGLVADYQMSAFLMAVYFRGLTPDELNTVVDVMLGSGSVLQLDSVPGRTVDKHSTGGVGDKVSLALAPLVASLGVPVPMISGRGLGHTGGTLDKLETIPGFRTDLTLDEFRAQMERIGCALIGQTAEIAPLDKRLYALRDVTATVEAIPLIASSIMSKKLAEGIDALLLDVKRGSGAFMPELDAALELATTMIEIGRAHGRDVVALVTAMDRPLGNAVGNALEMEEAILLLQGEGPEDLWALTVRQAAEMLCLGGVTTSLETALQTAHAALVDGRALEMMRRIIEAQGGNPAVLDDPALLPQAPVRRTLDCERDGYVAEVNALDVGKASVRLGAGRAALDSVIDPAVGFHITAKPGAHVKRGQSLATVYAASIEAAEAGVQALKEAITVNDARTSSSLPLISHRVTADGVEVL
jgi:pyrimidine-nucleoside phosphorylase